MEEFDGRTSNTLGLDVGKERKGIIKEAVKGDKMECTAYHSTLNV